MTKIYRSNEGETLAFVAHSDDLVDGEGFSYYGLFQYTVEDGEFTIYDFGDNEIHHPGPGWSGVNLEVLGELIAAERGCIDTVDLAGSDYWDIAALYDSVRENEVLMNALRAY